MAHEVRRRGAHYTPSVIAAELTDLALGEWEGSADRVPTVVDPTCGAGVFLLAALDALVARGCPPLRALDAVRGTDVDGGAVDVANAAIASWADDHGARDHGATTRGANDHGAWASVGDCFDTLSNSFDVVIGNPPFRAQLRSDTAHDPGERAALRARFGAVADGYVDLSVLIAVAAVEALKPGGVCVLILPRSFIASRHGARARGRMSASARLEQLWVPPAKVFKAQVDVVAPVLVRRQRGANEGDEEHRWASRLARADGVPAAPPPSNSDGVMSDVADVTAGFRDQYYGLVDHVVELATGELAPMCAPLVTSGLIAPGGTLWGLQSARFAKARWERPGVDLGALLNAAPDLEGWIEQVRRPKVVVASQTKIVEAAADDGGRFVPVTPVVSIAPRRDRAISATMISTAMIATAVSAPCVTLWLRHRLAGTGMSRDTIRIDAGSIGAVKLPTDAPAWAAATALLDAQPADREAWRRFGVEADRAHGLENSDGWIEWWLDRVVAASRV